MIIYHFIWDLGFFGFIEMRSVTSGLGLVIAQLIGGSFIFISGISGRVLSLSKDFRKKFIRRLGKLVAVTMLITITTFLMNNSSFIFFGILHFLAACSIISIFLVHFKKDRYLFLVCLASILLTLNVGDIDLPVYWCWLGFNNEIPASNDFYPLFPWINFYVAGFFLGKIILSYFTKIEKKYLLLKEKKPTAFSSLQLLGTNSLTIYILHQPIFFSLFFIYIGISS